jgi:tRNA1Val (adenine37-N6)-methyltransferase
MANNVFKFKQFSVDQTGCAMKINTDGVLLALLAQADDPKRILDIGTGTGVLALILAQRFEHAMVEAVEIEEQASITAGKNFSNSVFNRRLKVHHIAIEQYHHALKFDLIVCNPPYFVNDLRNVEEKKGIARHTNIVFFEELIAKVASLLSTEGQFWFILPIKQAELLVDKAGPLGLNVIKQIHLHSDAKRPEFRRIVCLSKVVQVGIKERFNIYECDKVYTQEYKLLLKDFFLEY